MAPLSFFLKGIIALVALFVATLFVDPTPAVYTATEQYSVTADGQRFPFLLPTAESTPSPITVVQNWPTMLKK